VIVARSVDARWLSNAWLVAARPDGPAVVVDAGAPPAPLLAAAKAHRLAITHVVLTHHHGDHVGERAAFAPAPCLMHALDAEHVPGVVTAEDGATLAVGALRLTLLHVPGHTRGQLNVLAESDGETPRVFTGDTLFRGSVGGTRGPGHGTFAQLRASILERILALPGETIVHPGHGEDSTVARERDANPFVLAWTGRAPTLDTPCTAFGREATLLLRERDYDGGFKAWVRWPDGTEDTVPGSALRA
jgi:glyoxylase-like metal-dependent hydrolase (beta-lactamase superfamily II)